MTHLIKCAAAVVSALLGIAVVVATLAADDLFIDKMMQAAERGDTPLLVSAFVQHALLASLAAIVFGGAIYLPSVWFTNKQSGTAATEVPLGERLWFACGCGSLIGIGLEQTTLPSLQTAPIVVPTTLMSICLCLNAFGRPRCIISDGSKVRNAFGWLVSLVMSAILVPACIREIAILMTGAF